MDGRSACSAFTLGSASSSGGLTTQPRWRKRRPSGKYYLTSFSMQPPIASLICGIGIAGLFYLDRGEKPRVSLALVIPAVWMFLNTTHPLSFWLGVSNQGSYTTQAYVDGN